MGILNSLVEPAWKSGSQQRLQPAHRSRPRGGFSVPSGGTVRVDGFHQEQDYNYIGDIRFSLMRPHYVNSRMVEMFHPPPCLNDTDLHTCTCVQSCMVVEKALLDVS